MNEKFSTFVSTLRREKGLTQAEIADRLGVTNKAVSKWETGESMPDSALLVPLADILGVTADELLRGERFVADLLSAETKPSEKNDVLSGQEKKKSQPTRWERIVDVISGLWFTLFLIGYFIAGCLGHWDYWALIPVGALTCGALNCILSLFDRETREKTKSEGDNPLCEGIGGTVVCLSVAAYLVLGGFFGMWHPWWIIAVAVVIVSFVVALLGEFFIEKK